MPVPSQSDFGSGVVVCLAKFSEHLGNRLAEAVATARWWEGLSVDRRARERNQARRYPRGDAARRLSFVDGGMEIEDWIHMWANGARDHFLDLDTAKAPPALRELADLVLSMGDSWPIRESGLSDWDRMFELWQEATLELDRAYGVIEPNWGTW